ncbi:hypothetical protein GCM10010112_22290 [Actinoplanes lobatus]|uniref:Uncharacterized protein n=1 Tax=Actinoplanes lobatus TaxID=113568 RepID=A0A7W7HIQ8_9ACTN|nr:hypothetical protein [Actinoplanes lobatus]GGN63228.1 hypothetical protein GCM10010112_22290 [Actinoplanes lobatus]GIE44786.1 hypothetical protein Alo02nite_76840 [Actinoplanes lobatus]
MGNRAGAPNEGEVAPEAASVTVGTVTLADVCPQVAAISLIFAWTVSFFDVVPFSLVATRV